MQRSCDRCKGEGRGGEGVANGHMTVGEQGGGGAGWGGEGGEEERGARRARHSLPVEPATLGPSGPPFWACPARHLWARSARHLGPLGPSSIKPVG